MFTLWPKVFFLKHLFHVHLYSLYIVFLNKINNNQDPFHFEAQNTRTSPSAEFNNSNLQVKISKSINFCKSRKLDTYPFHPFQNNYAGIYIVEYARLKKNWEYNSQLKNWLEKTETELGPVSDSYSGSARTSSSLRYYATINFWKTQNMFESH